MTTKTLACAAAALLALIPAPPGAASPPRCAAAWTDAPPTVDGKLDDACWARVRPLGGFTITATGKRPEASTSVRVVMDRENLYVAYDCSEPQMQRLRVEQTKRDDATWLDDCVELIIDPNNTKTTLFHIIVNAGGVVYDAKGVVDTPVHSQDEISWNGGITAAVVREQRRWTCEVKAPLADLDIEPGKVGLCGVNFARGRLGARSELSSWAPTTGTFANPSLLGEMRLSWPGLPSVDASLEPFDAVAVGDRMVYLRVPADPALAGRKLETRFEVSGADNYLGPVSLSPVPVSGNLRIPIPLQSPKAGTYKLTLNVTESETRATVYSAARFFAAVEPVTWDEQLFKLYQHRAEAALLLALPDDQARTSSLKVTLLAPVTGKALASKLFSAPLPKSLKVGFDLSGKPSGSYRMKAAMVSGGRFGKVIFSRPLPYEASPKISLDASGRLIVGGKPRFPVGIYTLQRKGNDGPTTDDILAEAAAAGFNTTVYYAYEPGAIRGLLKAAERNGIGVFAYASDPVAYREGKLSREKLLSDISQRGSHSSLLGWYLVDEPEGIGKSGGDIVRDLYQTVKENDPNHPCSLVIMSPGAARDYAHCADIVWIDPYPVPYKPVTFVGDSVAGAVDAVGEGKPVWVVPQAFDWNIWKTGKVDKVHRPTPVEERCMTYLALVHGAKGVIYWAHTASKYYIRDYPEHWEAMKRLAGELRDLSDPLLAPSVTGKLQVSGGPIDTMVKQHGGHTWVFAVNREPEACKASFRMQPLSAGNGQVMFESRSVQASAGQWSDSFAPLEVHVYRF